MLWEKVAWFSEEPRGINTHTLFGGSQGVDIGRGKGRGGKVKHELMEILQCREKSL